MTEIADWLHLFWGFQPAGARDLFRLEAPGNARRVNELSQRIAGPKLGTGENATASYRLRKILQAQYIELVVAKRP